MSIRVYDSNKYLHLVRSGTAQSAQSKRTQSDTATSRPVRQFGVLVAYNIDGNREWQADPKPPRLLNRLPRCHNLADLMYVSADAHCDSRSQLATFLPQASQEHKMLKGISSQRAEYLRMKQREYDEVFDQVRDRVRRQTAKEHEQFEEKLRTIKVSRSAGAAL